jgi:hydrogenase maturation protease
MANRVLVIGYGNPGRLDDGLGPALAEAVQELNLAGVTTDADYQLTVEDAERVARHAFVIFADAAVRGPAPFALRAVRPATEASFTTHSVEPGAVLTLSRDLFGGAPLAYTLAIRGYAFDGFGEELSPDAQRNLAAAVAFMQNALRSGEFRPARDLDPDLDAAAPEIRNANTVAPHCVRQCVCSAETNANRLN